LLLHVKIFTDNPLIPEQNIFQIDFSDLEIKISDFSRLLGYAEDKIPDQVNSVLHEILSEAKIHVEIRGGYLIKDIVQMDIGQGIIKLGEAAFYPGKTICENIRGSERLICFLCTAGEGITKWASATMDTDPLKFYIIDMLGSLIVENAVESFQSGIERALNQVGTNITNCYSPGYCGWKVVEQKKLFSLFPEGFCNISLNDSSLMTPMKSVSGIIGMGEQAEKRAYSCEICDAVDCIYRK
jgi:hypothetical protein